MPEEGYRKVQEKGEITLPKDFRKEHDIKKGDKIQYYRHKRHRSKIIIEVPE